MRSFFSQRSVLLTCLVALGLATTVSVASAVKPDPRVKKNGFRLFARSGGALSVNQVVCGLLSNGQICTDSLGSSTVPGSVWPKGTTNQYTFNSGLSIAGVIDPASGFAWSGDTEGAFFFDGAGKNNGEEVQPIYNASNPADFNSWPDAARVPLGDPGEEIFDPLLRGSVSASQGDVWFLTSDINPTALAGRAHPLGVIVETRGLAWNFPTGNQDIIYFIYTFYNITSLNPADYNVRPAMKAVLLEQAQSFQSRNEAAFGIAIPDGGYAINNAFVAFAADQDVTAAAGANYSTVNFPFSLGVTYHERFTPAPGNSFDPGIHAPPFLPGPGFVGTKYLRSPIIPGSDPPTEAGLAVFTLTTNRGAFPDPETTGQLYRYLSAQLGPTDPQCNTGDFSVTHICFIASIPSDTRTFQSTGPLNLPPGGQGTIVVGYIFAAPIATGKCPSIPCPVTMTPDPLTLLNASVGTPGVNAIDSAMGYRGIVATAGDPPTQDEFLTVPNSLLGKSLVAQEVFSNRFLLPFAPTSPEFFLVPGDGQVTVLWRPTPTEDAGDAFFAIASSPTRTDVDGNILPNPLYDPNYREFDVEGYRIYRGRVDTPNQLELVVQFDKSGTFITDFKGTVNPIPGCAPELGVGIGATPTDTLCPTPYTVPPLGQPFVESIDVPLAGELIQVLIGDRVKLADGTALITQADTVMTGGTDNFPLLNDTGVPFAFTDDGTGGQGLTAPRNNVRYFYSVTAFDFNSLASGPSSLESQRLTKAVTPVRSASNVALATLDFGLFGDDGTQLSGEGIEFALDPATGRFNGPPPPSTAVGAAFEPLVPALLPAINLTARIDSARMRADGEPYPGDGIAAFDCQGLSNGQGLCMQYFITFTRDGVPSSSSTVVNQPILTTVFGDPISVTAGAGQVAIDPDPAAIVRFGVPEGVTSFNASLALTVGQMGRWSGGENFNGRRDLANISPGGSRWFEGANETLDDPTYSIRVGHVNGVDSIFAPLSHIDQDPVTAGVQAPPPSTCMQVFGYAIAPFSRQADLELTWGAGGQIASVRDVTHHLAVPFKETPQAGWGIVPDGNGNGKIDWMDIGFVEDVLEVSEALGELPAGFCANPTIPTPTVTYPAPGSGTKLSQTVTLSPVSSGTATTDPAALATTGQGFGLYIAGHYHIFHLTGGAAPAEGTKWTLRAHSGTVRAATGAETTNPGGYTFGQIVSSPALEGLEVRFNVANPTLVRAATEDDLRQVHTVPDPYYVTSQFEISTDEKIIRFVNLPAQAIIRIYSSSGVLVSVIEHSAQELGGEETWNVRNRNNQIVASGVYFYHIESGNARRVGRFTVVNFGQ